MAGSDADIATTPTGRIGQRIRRARLQQNLTQGELAKGQFSVSYVSAVERGQIRPSLGALERLAARLELPVSELMTDVHDAEIDSALSQVGYAAHESEQQREEIAAALREAQVLIRQGAAKAAIALLDELLPQVRGPRDRAAISYRLAVAHLATDDFAAASRALLDALPLAERSGDRELLEAIHKGLGDTYANQGRYLLALEWHRAAYDAVRHHAVRDPGQCLGILVALGEDYRQLGESERASEVLQEAATLADDVLNPDRLAELYWSLSRTYAEQQQTAMARRYANQAVQTYAEVDHQRDAARAHARLGRASLQSGRLDDAEAHLRLAHQLALRLDDTAGLAEAARGLSEVYLRREQFDLAEGEAQQALQAAERQADPVERAETHITLAQTLEGRGRGKQADEQVRAALALVEGKVPAQQLGRIYARVAAFHEQRHEPARALEYLKKAWETRAHAEM